MARISGAGSGGPREAQEGGSLWGREDAAMRSLSERDQPAIREDLKNARRRFYRAIQSIDRLIKTDDENTVIERARPLIEAARHLPDAG